MNKESRNKQGSTEQKSKIEKYKLSLYVTGQTPRSVRSVQNLLRLCERVLKGRFELEVIDVYQQPSLAREQQIVAASTLIKTFPLPPRRLVGDFSNEERVTAGLDLNRA